MFTKQKAIAITYDNNKSTKAHSLDHFCGLAEVEAKKGFTSVYVHSPDEPYNLFGVKGNYLGSSVLMSTWEDDGSGNAYQIIAPFRQYPSYRESLTDYVSVVKQPWFSGVWRSNTYSYADSTSALQGVYATDTNYSNALNYIIQLHNLTYYDNLNQEDLSSGLVWNSYRGSYTDKSTLDIDVSYATANGIIAEHEEVSNGTGGSNLVWNDYRLQYTSQEVLDEDILWGNH